MYTCLAKAIYLYTVTKGRQIFPNFEYLEDISWTIVPKMWRIVSIKYDKKERREIKLSQLRFGWDRRSVWSKI